MVYRHLKNDYRKTNSESWDASLLLQQRRIQGYYLEWKSNEVLSEMYIEMFKTCQLIWFFNLKLGYPCGKESQNHWFSFVIYPFDRRAGILRHWHHHDNLRG